MKSNNPICQELYNGPKAFKQRSRTKTNQIMIQVRWHHFRRKLIGQDRKKRLKEEIMV
jgi:hypothetical protein